MPSDRNNTLNEVLIALNRSLLMYVQEAWPWTSKEGDAEQREITALAARRCENVASLVDLLESRVGSVDFGVFAAEFTDLHYIALDYLLTLLVESERQVTEVVAKAAQDLTATDPEAAHLLETILASEKDAVSRLQGLLKARTAAAAAK